MVKWAYCRIKCGFDMKYKFSLDKGHFITGDKMKRIKEVVVVEGKTDTATLKQLFDVDTIETHGSAINKKTIDLIKTTAQNRGVIILTDPDGPGKRMCDKAVQAVPNAKHAFVAQKDAGGKK